MNNIRNFCIIAHIDSGKSTLADRFLELTGTVDKRQMKPQYLDKMELERERGITIKMAPVRMRYRLSQSAKREAKENNDLRSAPSDLQDSEFILNLIDTPGHSDFSYEVSRALIAVEGAILLVDGTKGIQAQTLSNLRGARKAGLKIMGAVNKVDLNLPNLDKTISSVASLLGVAPEKIFRISAKTGEGIAALLEEVVKEVPPPNAHNNDNNDNDDKNNENKPSHRYGHDDAPRALIFDSFYDDHKGILAFIRIFGDRESSFRANDEFNCVATGARFKPKEIGFFSPDFTATSELSAGSIGYIATGLKEPEVIRVGDTITQIPNSKFQIPKSELVLPGYKEPTPVVFISFYPDGKTKFEDLKKGIERLRLSDPALSVEPEANDALGRGLKIGFLGQLHFEIIASRLEREFNLEFLTSFPTIAYRILEKGEEKIVKEPHNFPDNPEKVWQPIIKLEILSPKEYLNSVAALKNVFDINIFDVETLGDNVVIKAKMPLAELIRDFDDQLKSASSGYASFNYEIAGEEEADVVKLEILVVGEVVPALTRIVAEKDVEHEGRRTVERLRDLLPKQQFSQAIQASSRGRIIARETIAAMRKDVTGYLYGGDRSRKMKLWKKQQRGKERLKGMAKVEISPETFREILKK